VTPRSHRLSLATGLAYHVLEWGEAGRDVTYVLVHGFTDLAYGWREVAERLAPHARVLAPDLRPVAVTHLVEADVRDHHRQHHQVGDDLVGDAAWRR